MKEFVKIENNEVTSHICAPETPAGKGWKEVENFYGHVGIDQRAVNWDTGKVKPLEEQVSIGLLADNRGVYWNKQSKERQEVKSFGMEIPDEWTNIEPPSQFAKWNEAQNNWEVDEELRRVETSLMERSKRYELLYASDWTQLQDSPANAEAWAGYRQKLRDVPAQSGFPYDIEWPEIPGKKKR